MSDDAESTPSKLLIVDDKAANLDLLREMLAPLGHHIFFATSGAKALEIATSAQPDLVLLDANSDGFGALRLYQDLKQQFPDLAVMVYQCRNYGDVDRIKGAVADSLETNTAAQSDNLIGDSETTNEN